MAPAENGLAFFSAKLNDIEDAIKEDKATVKEGIAEIVCVLKEISSGLKEVSVHMLSLKTTMDIVVAQHKDIIRWLLIVVCVHALGNHAPEIVQSIIKAAHG